MATEALPQSVVDARASRQGVYSAWLKKVKSDNALMKWLSSSTTRYFTIDFDSQIFFYSHSKDQKKVSQPIPFKDILGAERLPPPASKKRGSNQGCGFILRTKQRAFELHTDSGADAALWAFALNAARDIGKSAKGISDDSETLAAQRQVEQKVCSKSIEGTDCQPEAAGSSQTNQDDSNEHQEQVKSSADSRALDLAEATAPKQEESVKKIGMSASDNDNVHCESKPLTELNLQHDEKHHLHVSKIHQAEIENNKDAVTDSATVIKGTSKPELEDESIKDRAHQGLVSRHDPEAEPKTAPAKELQHVPCSPGTGTLELKSDPKPLLESELDNEGAHKSESEKGSTSPVLESQGFDEVSTGGTNKGSLLNEPEDDHEQTLLDSAVLERTENQQTQISPHVPLAMVKSKTRQSLELAFKDGTLDTMLRNVAQVIENPPTEPKGAKNLSSSECDSDEEEPEAPPSRLAEGPAKSNPAPPSGSHDSNKDDMARLAPQRNPPGALRSQLVSPKAPEMVTRHKPDASEWDSDEFPVAAVADGTAKLATAVSSGWDEDMGPVAKVTDGPSKSETGVPSGWDEEESPVAKVADGPAKSDAGVPSGCDEEESPVAKVADGPAKLDAGLPSGWDEEEFPVAKVADGPAKLDAGLPSGWDEEESPVAKVADGPANPETGAPSGWDEELSPIAKAGDEPAKPDAGSPFGWDDSEGRAQENTQEPLRPLGPTPAMRRQVLAPLGGLTEGAPKAVAWELDFSTGPKKAPPKRLEEKSSSRSKSRTSKTKSSSKAPLAEDAACGAPAREVLPFVIARTRPSSQSQETEGGLLGELLGDAGGAKRSASSLVPNFHCMGCDFQVLRIENHVWANDGDVAYMFLRNNYPNVLKLRAQLETRSGCAAFCCQCSSRSGDADAELADVADGLRWKQLSM